MNSQRLTSRLERLPMLRVAVPFAAGILLAEHYSLPLWFTLGGFLLLGALSLLLRSGVSLLCTLFLLGIGVATIHDTPHALPRNTSVLLRMQIDGIPSERGQYRAAEACVGAWCGSDGKKWHGADARIVLYTDSLTPLTAGETIYARTRVRPFEGGAESYRSLMRHRGFAGTAWLSERDILRREQPSASTLHRAAVTRLERLGLEGDTEAVCRAMAAGDKSRLTAQLRAAYARTGTSHLMAVSGLHVGIVFGLVNLLLWWMPLLRRGHLWRNAAAVVCIWLYAAATGFAPGTVRAAVMFSVLQFALASSSVYVASNALAAAAFGMLLFRPGYLFDISFQLSFVAVISILAWGVPLCRRLRTRRAWIDYPVASLVISLAASLGTAPLVAHTFGITSLVGLVVNPPAIFLSTIIVLAAVVWMLLPLGFLTPLFSGVLSVAVGALNSLVSTSAALPYAAVEYTLSTGHTVALYLFFIAATALMWCREPKKSVHLRK